MDDARDDPIDFGAIDPRRNPERWEGMVAAVMARARVAEPPGLGEAILALMSRWRRPILALSLLVVAAMVPVAVWAPWSDACDEGGTRATSNALVHYGWGGKASAATLYEAYTRGGR